MASSRLTAKVNADDPAADGHPVTGAKCRDVLSCSGKYESAGAYLNETVFLKSFGKFVRQLVHQVSDWCSGVAIKMGRRQGATKEHIWIDT